MTKNNIFNNLINKLSIGILVAEQDGKIIFLNETIKQMIGYSEEEIKTIDDFSEKICPEKKYQEKINAFFQDKVLNDMSNKTFEVKTAAGKYKFFKFRYSGLADGKMIFEVIDVNNELEQKQSLELKEIKERLELAVEGANIGVWDWNAQDNSVHYNKNWAQMLGYQVSELENNLNTWLEIIHPEDKKQALKDVNNHLNGDTKVYFNEHRLKTKSGKWKWIRDIGKVIDRDNEGNPLRIVGVHIDIDKQKRSSKKIEYSSMHDELTGLYNRRYFNNEMNRLHNSRKYPLSLIVGDLNRLKLINDNYGHSMGDKYIKTTARILKETIRSEDIVARIGGDEFALILPETNNDKAEEIVERILNNIEGKNRDDDLPEPLSIALGYETINSSEEDIEKCYSRADKKMYKQKFKDRNKNNSVIN